MEDALLNIDLIAEPAYRTRKFRPKVLQPLPDEIVARIPYEIIEHILDQIRDRKTLSACTRVCYGWHHSSRRRLFAHSAVRLNTFDKISEFVDEIHSSSAKSSIAPYIQSISISMCFDFLLYDEPFSFSYADGAVYVASALRHLASLTSLRSLKLTLQIPELSWFTRKSSIRKIWQQLVLPHSKRTLPFSTRIRTQPWPPYKPRLDTADSKPWPSLFLDLPRLRDLRLFLS